MTAAEKLIEARAALDTLEQRRVEYLSKSREASAHASAALAKALALATSGDGIAAETPYEDSKRNEADRDWAAVVIAHLNDQIQAARLREIDAHINERREAEAETRARGRAQIEQDRAKVKAVVGYALHERYTASPGMRLAYEADAINREIEQLKYERKQLQ